MRKLLCFIVFLFGANYCLATGEPSTYFNIYLPPNNDPIGRDVALVITALYDSTSFSIIDDGADGDTDDSKTGMLMQGQSYVLFMRNNGVNDDAPHSGESASKNDGDYFIITSSKLLFASQATLSSWQHDWVASFNKTSKGQKFIVYAQQPSSSNNDIDVFAYEDSTMVVIKKISTQPTLVQGYTSVDMNNGTIVAQKMLDIGKDIITWYSNGRDLMQAGCTYLIESNKPVTVQYGALYQYDTRDGGGYVPSSNGSSAGSLFYFAVPYQAANEQEIRIVSWDSSNAVSLDRYANGAWVNVKNWSSLNKLQAGDWIGKDNSQTFPNVFRVTCTPGKKVSVFEANWLETGSTNTSDIATMASSSNGTSAGRDFLIYMPPPSSQQNITDPFTGLKLSKNTHAYLYANKACTVTVKDAYTKGTKLNRTYTIAAGRYVDVNLTLADWKSIYNGDGNPATGPERPYLLISSTNDVSVMISNSGDNWMMYFGSSLTQSFTQQTSSTQKAAAPGDTVTVSNLLDFTGTTTISAPAVQVMVSEGAIALQSTLTDSTTNTAYNGTITSTTGQGAVINFNTLPSVLDSSSKYVVTTEIMVAPVTSGGGLIVNHDLLTVDMTIGGTVNGVYQQSSSSVAITNSSANTSNLQFSRVTTGVITTDTFNSWTSNWIDINSDGYPDLLVNNYDKNSPNVLYVNAGNGSFSRVTNSGLTSTKTKSVVGSAVADLDNDGTPEVVCGSNIDQQSLLFRKSNGTYAPVSGGALTNDKGYAHTVNVVDYDRDGKADIFISEYFPSNYCRLYHNDGNNQYSRVTTGPISQIANYVLGATWADYDNDGYPDLFVPVNGTSGTVLNRNNMLFHNDGNGNFSQVTTGSIVNDAGNSTASAWGDYDNDGLADLFVSNASGQKNFLYHNNGNGNFTKITAGAIVNDKGNWHGCSWIDYDNDGYLDLYVVSNNFTEAKKLYHNNKDGSFTSISYEPLCAALPNTIGTSWADYDRDGFPDVYVTATGSKNRNFLFHNNGNSNHWLHCYLTGVTSNRSALGARVLIKTTINNIAMWQSREIATSAGIGCQNELCAMLGLGGATKADSIIIKWPSGIIQYLTNVNANQKLNITEENAGKIAGNVYVDGNTNCSKDNWEKGCGNIKMKLMPGNVYLNTDSSGNFSVWVKPGSYTLTQETSPNWQFSCAASYAATVATIGIVNVNLSIPVQPLSQAVDAYVTIGSEACRRGFKSQMVIECGNNGSLAYQNGAVQLTMPQGMHLLSSVPAYTSATGNTYTWQLSDLGTAARTAIHITDSIGLSLAVGDTVQMYAAMLNAGTEQNAANNSYTLQTAVVGAIDPNDITVFPAGWGVKAYVQKTDTLTYTVNFQNVGTYLAENIMVEDTLPVYLNPATFKYLSSSHSCNYIIEGNVLKFVFSNIMLPDSATAIDGSKGFVTFSFLPAANCLPEMRIPNQASIRFDYEDPLATNEVSRTITPEISLNGKYNDLFVFPNPIKDVAVVMLSEYVSNYLIEDITVMNVVGKTIYTQHSLNTNTFNITKAVLKSAGTYIIIATDKAGNKYMGKLTVE